MVRKAAAPSLSEASAAGRLEGLRALRDHLARELEGQGEEKQTAPLARQLREVLREIEQIEAALPAEGSRVDELATRRTARSPAPARARATKAKGAAKRSG